MPPPDPWMDGARAHRLRFRCCVPASPLEANLNLATPPLPSPQARKMSSALSAASSACDHVRDWVLGTAPGRWVSMGVPSDGSAYGIPAGIVYSLPVSCSGGKWRVVHGLPIDEKSRAKVGLFFWGGGGGGGGRHSRLEMWECVCGWQTW